MKSQTLFALVSAFTASVVSADGLIKFSGAGKCLDPNWSDPYDLAAETCILAGPDGAIWIEKGRPGSNPRVCLRLSTGECDDDIVDVVTMQKGNCYDIPHKEGAARWRAYQVIDGPCPNGGPGTLTSPCRIPIVGGGLGNEGKCDVMAN